MFFKSKSKEPEPQKPLPRWMAWLMFGFLGYVVVIGNLNRTTPPPVMPAAHSQSKEGIVSESQQVSQRDFPAIRQALDIHNWKRALNPALAEGLAVRDFTVGTGRPASCGDRLTVMLRGRNAKGENFDEKHEEKAPLTFTVGAGKTYAALEQAVIGMQVGGERVIDAPPVLVYGTAQVSKGLFSVQMQVTLTGLMPEMAAEAAPVLLAGDTQPSEEGARCGQAFKAKVTLWDASGKRVWQDKAMAITLGAGETPIGLSHALVGLAKGQSRTLMLPPEYQAHEGKGWGALAGKQLAVVQVVR